MSALLRRRSFPLQSVRLPMTRSRTLKPAIQHGNEEPMQQAQQLFASCVSRTKEALSPRLKKRRQQDGSEAQDLVLEKPASLRSERSSRSVRGYKVMSAREDEATQAFTCALHDKTDELYRQRRHELLLTEKAQAWDAKARASASPAELLAAEIVFNIREHERDDPELYGELPSEAVPLASVRDMGGRFLINKERIDRTRLYDIALHAPKGAHLHLHFNSEIKPEVLFPHARRLPDTMFVRTTGPLLKPSDFAERELVFNVLPKTTPDADIFSADYCPDFRNTTNNPWMRWTVFQERFPLGVTIEEYPPGLNAAEAWAREKMIITRRIAYSDKQTHNGAWACFNQGTRAFKGLVNYESVYRWYIGAAIANMIEDRVMYAELRPMLLDKSIPADDGVGQLDHKAQMQIIIEEVSRIKTELKAKGELDKFPFGLKIIYSTPRSIPRAKMESELQDCIRLKLQFPDLICGFDLVGAEDRPNNISFYADLLVAFTETCKQLKISIPFMFHAGETLLDTGGSHHPDNSNLYDSLLLNAKRVGHGYALLKHPLLIEKFKAANIALELCPISNELLHLCGNSREHPYPALLAAGLHCSLNADNPSLFRLANNNSSTLSHEFYQVMVGDTRMTLHGWRQLVEWSLEHSCLTAEEMTEARTILAREWETFCQWIVDQYGEYAAALSKL